ncbi:MAG: hypothetical protein KDA53_13485 [Hyphomonas sp.]|nr:hypothetical protein [Hyphomonas sp.]
MSQLPFSFGNAISHYARTGGPKGFLLKFALAYGLVAVVIQALGVWLQWPLYQLYIEMFAIGGGDIEAYVDDLSRVSNQTTMRSFMIMPLGILAWVLFESASQRRYMRGEPFSLRFSADEGRVFVVGLIWFALAIGLYIGLIFVVLVPIFVGVAMGESGIGFALFLGGLFLLGYFLVFLWLAARLSAASALTIRDRDIRFFESWRVTRGKGWTIVGTWIVLGLIMMLIFLLLYLVMAGVGFGILSAMVPGLGDGSAMEGDIFPAISSPAFWGPLLAVAAVMFMVQAAFQHILGGPAALAALNDDAWTGNKVATEFQ